jgi:hypothetical protein
MLPLISVNRSRWAYLMNRCVAQSQFGALAAFSDGTKIERMDEVVYIRLEHIQRLQVCENKLKLWCIYEI